jgi:hypothetical protein
MKKLLLPYAWKYVGALITAAGVVMAILYYFFNIKFRMPVFAVYSSFVGTKMFESVKTNVTDELTLLLLIAGLGLIVFSKEKNESEEMDGLRSDALSKAALLNTIFLVFSVLFIYGSGFIVCLVLNLFSLPVFYLIIFHLMKRKKSIGNEN